MEQSKGILINEDLLTDNLAEYMNKDLEYINVPNSVGIATEYANSQKRYIVYLNNERGYNFYTETTNSLVKAVIIARKKYKSLIMYYKGTIDAYSQILKKR